MTRDEAIKILKELAGYEKTMDLIQNYSVSVQDALYMAINALKNEQSAKWVLLSDKDLNDTFDFLHKGDAYMNYECSNCGHRVYNELRGYGDNRTTYCPNCGARMREGGQA
jgi:DNA-directed RNA polymerase subunit RPC12/RpoP